MPAKKLTKKKVTKKKPSSKKPIKNKVGEVCKDDSCGCQPLGKKSLAALIVVLIAVILVSVFALNESAPAGEAVFDLYVMSQCPPGTQAETQLVKAVQRFDGDVDLNINYIVNSQGDNFQSLHGQPEVDENMRQLCVEKLFPEKHYDYLLCFNQNYQAGQAQYANCANQLSIDTEAIASCVVNDGVELLKACEVETNKVGASASPTVYLNGKSYNGGRLEISYITAICEALGGEHEACFESVKLEVVVLTDNDCSTCNTANIESVTTQFFPGANIRKVDVDDAEGQALVEENGLVFLPAFIFEKSLEETFTWENNPELRSSFMESGNGFRLRDEAIGANWFIDDEARVAYEAEMQRQLEAQQEQILGYVDDNLAFLGFNEKPAKPRLDYFVMSFCPYGNPADEAAYGVYQVLGDKVDIVPHYIINVAGDTVGSLHGEQEGNQGVRELCALRELGYESFFKFTVKVNEMCDSRNADTCWETAADAVGIDKEVIRNCEANDKLTIAAEEDRLVQGLVREYPQNGQITLIPPQVSPTFLVNGKTFMTGRDAESIKNALCLEFDEAPEECGEVIPIAPAPTQAPSAGGSC
ncbi:hypothetical protein H8D36_04000 [archaeon]|nr:hypothetical protein [archaeon]MBL7056897.1 hypothetical protein [Candidatus Woesearchaeota archaeon]